MLQCHHAVTCLQVRLDVVLRAVWRSNNFAASSHKIAAAPFQRADDQISGLLLSQVTMLRVSFTFSVSKSHSFSFSIATSRFLSSSPALLHANCRSDWVASWRRRPIASLHCCASAVCVFHSRYDRIVRATDVPFSCCG
jgi:hypothetical protein